MALKKEKIVSNIKRYLDTAEKYGVMTPKLEEFLGEEFIKAPASSFLHLHNAFEGGLVDHILRVTKHAFNINKHNLPDSLKIDETSLFKVTLLHQIGKTKLYTPETNDWWVKNRGRTYEFNEDLVSMRVGQRSAYYALSCGVELTEDEYIAITNFDKIDDDQAEWHNSTVGDVLKMAVRLAIMEEKKIAK